MTLYLMFRDELSWYTERFHFQAKTPFDLIAPASQMWRFAALQNNFGFCTVGQKKEAMWRCHIGLWEIMIILDQTIDRLIEN